ncbi:HAMP domain-containing protein [Neolewinella aurantiaca]|uniref:histidine kinase n=1 Tax=Neolewinella aurantiaca TaxID=2602767 RepID=A0A5C7FIW7_9BACT|nr:ATP-binding protein [Neolewinella aurantiaca]TXF90548.1 HAMP domain-containing protein [Neolewinella aurantiaca]
MSSSIKYILYLTVLHLALGVLAYYQFRGNGAYVLAAEVLLLGSGYIALRIYRSLISPLRLLGQGAAALEDKDFSVKLMPTGSFEMDRIVKVYNNMIDQLREERISGRQQEVFLDRLLRAAELGVVVLNYDGEVASMNPWMEAQCQDPAFYTAILEPALHPPSGQEEKEDNEKLPQQATTTVRTGPGNRRYHIERSGFVDRGFERGFLIVQDVTTDLMTAEKEAYGKVIRMMAHEVNNSNAAIISVLRSLLEAATEGESELPELSKDYLPAVIGRAENMTVFMRNFARVVRLSSPNRKRTDLNQLLRRTGEVMGPILRENNISLSYELAPSEVIVSADPAQLEQVIINALTNARESIGSGGNILISSSSFPAGFVVADDGPGIPAPAAGDVFTPFFSTKPTGQGVGLTLTREILEAHGARYGLATEEDGWTRLRVVFG